MGAWGESIGSAYLGNGRCRFRVWAPLSEKLEVHLVAPADRLAELSRGEQGDYELTLDGVKPGARYLYRLDEGQEWPDPASRCQPEGVHAASQVTDPAFPWTDRGWSGRALSHYVLYELHVGTFTPEGTFEAIIPRLDYLKELGVTALELMPVAQFPGARNWGYDGVYPFAAQNSYGGPAGLKRLVDACHRQELAVVLDVVYNHLGPEGNYFGKFGHYFTRQYQTPWGDAINFDGPHNGPVRRFFIENALYWTGECHIDALRLDAVHAIKDFSARPFLEELAESVHEQGERLNRRIQVIAESDLNDTRLIQARELGGFDLDAQWNDDFHHALHALLTGERQGYYQDFGRLADLAKAYAEGYVYGGQFSAFRERAHGRPSRAIPARKFIVCGQNHDQIGNRMLGERLSALVSFAKLKLVAGAVLLAPYVPLLFMGEEYGEPAPFLYFTSHADGPLAEAVRRGRAQEFSGFAWRGEVPDPQDELTFLRSRINPALRGQGWREAHFGFYKELIQLRRTVPALACLSKENLEARTIEEQGVLIVRRWKGQNEALILMSFGEGEDVSFPLDAADGGWIKLVDSEDPRWAGQGSLAPESLAARGKIMLTLKPSQVVLYANEEAKTLIG